MAKTNYIDIENFDEGLVVLEDPTKAPLGSAREMVNALITDRKGIGRRPGTSTLGTYNNNANGCKSFFTFVKSFGSREIPMKNYDDEVEYYHPDHGDWTRLESGFTVGSEFGYKEHLVNTENEDYVYFCNRTEEYRRWPGAITLLNGALAGGETAVVVDSVLKSDIFDSHLTAEVSGSSATTLTINTTPWAADQWINFYVYIKTGTHAGKIRKITDSANNSLTFDTLGSDPGSCDFEIRLPAFAATGTLVINSSTVAYTAIPTATSFTVASAPAAADDSPVTVLPTKYPGAPRGNRLEVHYTRMIVGNVRSALSRDSSGNLQGSQSTGSYFVSKLLNATDFGFTATRVAGEGDIVSVPYGGGDITDIVDQEDQFYVFKANYIESAKYSQDTNDIITRTQLKSGIGSIAKTFKGSNDVFFITDTNEFTSLGRVEQKDITPQSLNIGYRIKRLLDTMDFTQTVGGEAAHRILFAGKENSDDLYNNRIVVYNQQTKTFEGMWLLNANGFDYYDGEIHYAESNTPNVFKMFTGLNDVRGTDEFGFTCRWVSNWMNLTASDFNYQALQSIAVEGYILSGTELTFKFFKDFGTSSFLDVSFSPEDDPDFLSGDPFNVFLGGQPLAIDPMGVQLSEPDPNDGMRHFKFQFYFPPQYGTHFSFEIANSGLNQQFEVTRVGLGLSEDVDFDQNAIKTTN